MSSLSSDTTTTEEENEEARIESEEARTELEAARKEMNNAIVAERELLALLPSDGCVAASWFARCACRLLPGSKFGGASTDAAGQSAESGSNVDPATHVRFGLGRANACETFELLRKHLASQTK